MTRRLSDLALRFTAEHRRVAAETATAWASNYPIPAWGLAEGAGAERLARNWGRAVAANVLEALAAAPEGGATDPLDEAMHTVWLEGNWTWLTRRMTTEAAEAAVAAVLRYDRAMKADDPEEDLLTRESLAWWD
jgi:hypothetical protein